MCENINYHHGEYNSNSSTSFHVNSNTNSDSGSNDNINGFISSYNTINTFEGRRVICSYRNYYSMTPIFNTY